LIHRLSPCPFPLLPLRIHGCSPCPAQDPMMLDATIRISYLSITSYTFFFLSLSRLLPAGHWRYPCPTFFVRFSCQPDSYQMLNMILSLSPRRSSEKKRSNLHTFFPWFLLESTILNYYNCLTHSVRSDLYDCCWTEMFDFSILHREMDWAIARGGREGKQQHKVFFNIRLTFSFHWRNVPFDPTEAH
jgi:hypothetical protein